MVGRGLVGAIAGVGGLLIIVGGLVAFLRGVASGVLAESIGPGFNGLALGIAAAVLGLLILVVSGFSQFGRAQSKLGEGIVLLLLGLIAYIFLGTLLITVGGVLAALAGLILLVQAVVRR